MKRQGPVIIKVETRAGKHFALNFLAAAEIKMFTLFFPKDKGRKKQEETQGNKGEVVEKWNMEMFNENKE